MKRKRARKKNRATRRLIALSAAAATVWTVAQTVNWPAVSQSLAGLRQGSELVEQIVRQELIRPAEEGGELALSAWEQLVLTESPQLLSSQAAVNEEQASQQSVRDRAEAARRAEEEKAAAQKAREKEVQEKQEREEQKKEKAAQTVSIDTSKLKASAIRVDNHTNGISVKASDYFDKKVSLKLKPAKEGPQILIMHTHTTEAYTKGRKDT